MNPGQLAKTLTLSQPNKTAFFVLEISLCQYSVDEDKPERKFKSCCNYKLRDVGIINNSALSAVEDLPVCSFPNISLNSLSHILLGPRSSFKKSMG